MPKGNAVQAVLYDKTKGMVFDIGSKGKLNSGMESFLELYGIKELKGARYEVAEVKKGERTKKAPLPFTTQTWG